LNKEKFFTVVRASMGKADATRAREFGYNNRRSVRVRRTVLSAMHEVVIGPIPPSKLSADKCSFLMGKIVQGVDIRGLCHLTLTSTPRKIWVYRCAHFSPDKTRTGAGAPG
jgi:hypothetical protein